MAVISELLIKLGVDGDEVDGGMSRAKKSVLAGAAVIGAAGLAASKKLYDIGSVFDDVEDTIRVGTGATGAHLDALTKSAERVGSVIPATFEDIGTTIADVNTRLGLTGPVLEKVTKQVLEAGRLTGEAIDIKTISGALNAFGVKGAETSKVLDDIYRVSQATGVGMNELASSVSRNAPLLTQFGFGISDSVALLGTLDKAGLNGNKTIATLSRAMVEFADQGLKPRAALEQTIGQIEKFTKTGQDAKAINLAADIFGTRGASQFVAAVKSGKVNLDDLMGSTGATSDTILKASRDTADFSEKWAVFKNKVLLKLQPLAEGVFAAIGNGMDWISKSSALDDVAAGADRVGGALQRTGEVVGSVVGWFAQHETVAKTLAITLGVLTVATGAHAAVLAVSAAGGLAAWLLQTTLISGATRIWAAVQWVMTGATTAATAAQWAMNAALTANPIGLVIAALVALGVGLVVAYKKSETFRKIVNGALNGVKAVAGAVAGFFTKRVPAAFQIVQDAAGRAIGWVKSNWPLILGILTGPFGLAAVAIVKNWDKIKAGGVRVFEFVKSIPGRIKDGFSKAGTLLLDAGRDIIDGLISGIGEKIGALKDKLSSITKLIPDIKGPPAKDRKLLTPAGRMIMEGLIGGVASGEAGLKKRLERVTKSITRSLKAGDITKSAAAGMRSTVKAVGKELSGLSKQVDTVRGKIDQLRNDRASKASSVADSIAGELDLGSLASSANAYGFGGGSTTFGAVSGMVTGVVARIKRFVAKIGQLRKAGVPSGLIDEIVGLGSVDGIAVADAVLSGSGAQIRKLATDYNSIASEAAKLGNVVAGAFADSKIKAQQALLDGLLAKPAIRKAAKSLAKTLTKEIATSVGGSNRGSARSARASAAASDATVAARRAPISRATTRRDGQTGQAAGKSISEAELATLLSKLGFHVELGVGKKTATKIVRVGQTAAEKRR